MDRGSGRLVGIDAVAFPRKRKVNRAAFPRDLAEMVASRWDIMIAGDHIAPACPPKEKLRTILEASYLAAASPEEGRYSQFNVVVTKEGLAQTAKPDINFHPFVQPRTLTVSELQRLAPASDLRKSAIWITWDDNEICVAGLVDLGTSWHRARLGLSYNYAVPNNLLIQVDRPGRMKVYQGQFHVGSLIDGEVTRGGVEINAFLHTPVDQGLRVMGKRFAPPKFEEPKDYHGFCFTALWNVFSSIANSIALSGHGGMLVVAPVDATEMVKHLRIKYPTGSDFLQTAFVDFINARNVTADFWEQFERANKKSSAKYFKSELVLSAASDRLTETTRFVAQLAGCDGAIVLSSDLRLMGFGAEVCAEFASGVAVSEVIDEFAQKHKTCDVEQFGMRHRSAIKLVSQAADAHVVVVSQDGPISVVWYEDKRVMVKRGVSLVNRNIPWA